MTIKKSYKEHYKTLNRENITRAKYRGKINKCSVILVHAEMIIIITVRDVNDARKTKDYTWKKLIYKSDGKSKIKKVKERKKQETHKKGKQKSQTILNELWNDDI